MRAARPFLFSLQLLPPSESGCYVSGLLYPPTGELNMGHITVCSDHKNMPLLTSFGELHFDGNGECKLDSEIARAVLAKYKPTFWAKKSGKPEVAPVVVESKMVKKDEKTPENNFGFPENVHVSKSARAAFTDGNLTADEILTNRQKALSTTDVPKSTIDDDLIASGAATDGRGGATLRKAPVVEDVSEEAPKKKLSKSFSKSYKVSGKKGR